MTPALAALALVVLAQADAGVAAAPPEIDVQSGASPATLDAEAAVDVLAANVVNDALGAGTPKQLTAVELGLSAKLHATAFDSHAHVDLDYAGRQPVAGSAQNTAIHLLYQAEVSADFLDQRLLVGLGRFLAPSAALLPVDGLRAQLRLWHLELQLFGGRRAITSTDASNVDFSTFLPAAGGSVALHLERLQAEVGLTYSRDQVPLLMGTENPKVDAFSAYARAVGRPLDWLVLGGEVATAQRASYVLGPTWTSVELRARTADVFYAVGFVELRPLKSLRIDYDLHHQQAALFREGLRLDPNDPQVTADGFTPSFTDNRLRVRWRPFGLGWLGPEVRLRLRPDWNEWRIGANADLAPGWARGVCVRGLFTYEKMAAKGSALAPADRSFWSASLGWRGHGLDVALGASDVERSVLPISSRVYTPYNDTPTQPVDLSPFMLQAERIAFVRAYYGSGIWFAGLDFEQSLIDGRERRVFAQLGARLDKQW